MFTAQMLLHNRFKKWHCELCIVFKWKWLMRVLYIKVDLARFRCNKLPNFQNILRHKAYLYYLFQWECPWQNLWLKEEMKSLRYESFFVFLLTGLLIGDGWSTNYIVRRLGITLAAYQYELISNITLRYILRLWVRGWVWWNVYRLRLYFTS